jgi:hypothetical protein
MNLLKRTLLLLVMAGAFNFCGNCHPGIKRAYFTSPGVHIGYTFGALLTYGVTLDAGIKTAEAGSHYGISLSYSHIQTKKHVHRLRTFSFMGGTSYAQFKAGWGRVRNKWGYGNQNKCITHGILLEAGFSYPDEFSPMAGFRTFRYRRSDWAWFTSPYNTLYLEYRYNAIRSDRIQHRLGRSPG